MLILSRRPHEVIIIGGDVQIKVLSIRGNQVTLGIDAPPTVQVDRQEVRIRRESLSAEKTGGTAA